MALADQITALEDALARGVKSVAYDGHSVTYQSAAEMRQTLAALKRRAGQSTPTPFYPEVSRDGS